MGRKVQVTEHSPLAVVASLLSQLETLRTGYHLTSKPSQGSQIDYLIRSHVAAPKLGLLKESVFVLVQMSRYPWRPWLSNTQQQLRHRHRAIQLAGVGVEACSPWNL